MVLALLLRAENREYMCRAFRDSTSWCAINPALKRWVKLCVPGVRLRLLIRDFQMKCPAFVAILFPLIAISLATAQPPTPVDPYQPVLDRLQAITTIPLDGWKVVG